MRPDAGSLLAHQHQIAQSLLAEAPVHAVPWRVHRNTIWRGWVEAMGDAYPITKALIGPEMFGASARRFLRETPPNNAALKLIGGGFSSWIAGHAVEGVPPYLADIAMLERLWLEAFHAPDADVMPPEMIGQFDPARVLDLTVEFHPSLGIIASDYPIDVIFDLHSSEAIEQTDQISLPDRGVHITVSRPGVDVLVAAISATSFSLITILLQGATLGEALDHAGGLDLALPDLQSILAHRLITNLKFKGNT